MVIASIDSTRKYILMQVNLPLLDSCRLNRAGHGDCLYRYNADKIIIMQAHKPLLDSCRLIERDMANASINTMRIKGALYKIWCGVNRLGDSGVKVV